MNIDNLFDGLNTIFLNIMNRLMNYLPSLVAGLLVLLFGKMAGLYVKKIIVSVLKGSGLSQFFSEQSNLAKFLRQAEFKVKPEEMVGEIIKWIIYVITFIAAVNTLGLPTISDLLMRLVNYIPSIVAALLILVMGIVSAGILEGLIKGSLTQINATNARIIAKGVSYTLLLFTLLMAISELGIAEDFIQTLFTGIIAMLALALGLAFGLGSKDLVKRVLEQWYDNLRRER